MKAKFLTSLSVIALWMLLAASFSSAQGDRAKALLGKWEGDVQVGAGAGKNVGDSARTLIVESVEQKDGKLMAAGKWGITGKGLGKVDIEVDEGSDRVGIRFVTGANSTIRLSLVGPKQLTGTLTVPGPARTGNDRALNLEKKD